ncbi:MAG: GNAT family N-acetyltransferase [Paracoccaceae bacterium]
MPRPVRAKDPYDWPALLTLIRTSYAYMEGRIDPPSSMHRLTAENIARQAETGEVWVIEEAGHPVACVFLTPRQDALYLGKLAVAQGHRGRGFARQLVAKAENRARQMGLPALELQTRVELLENHVAFAALGFMQTGETSHAGYDRPTSLTLRKTL